MGYFYPKRKNIKNTFYLRRIMPEFKMELF